MNAAMRRKDFELIATALKDSRVLLMVGAPGAAQQHRQCCIFVAAYLAAHYPAFNRERFLRDCGVQP
jgi:hypothetical protein